MVNFITISLFVGYFFVLFLSTFTLFKVLTNKKKYGTDLIAILLSATTFTSGVLYSSLYICSVVVFFSLEINLILWKISIVMGFLTLTITIIIYSFFKEYKKIPIRPFVFLSAFYGLLIGILIIPESITIEYDLIIPDFFTIIDPSDLHFKFNLFTGILIILLQGFISLYFIYISIVIYMRKKKKERSLPLLLNSLIFLIPISMFISYIINPLSLFRELYITLLWITYLTVNVMLIKEPEMFFILPNEIYAINVYHKSGILLYSYNFQNEFEYDPVIWGNTIIGLNHILSEFVDKKENIDVIQTKNADLVVRYDYQNGYAVVLITNRKNNIIDHLIDRFSEEFNEAYHEELNAIQDLNRIIEISEFSGLKEIIEQIFILYL